MKHEEEVIAAFRDHLRIYSDEMIGAVEKMKNEISGQSQIDSLQVKRLKNNYLKIRLAFKKIEMFSSYFLTASEQDLNGPVVPEIEDESEANPQIEYPHGLQVIEACLWSDAPQTCRKEMISEINLLQQNVNTLSVSFKTINVDEPRFLEAIQYHVIRTFTLGIARFDTPECNNALSETQITMQALRDVFISAYKSEKENQYVKEVLRQLNRTVSFFNKVSSLNEMNYLSCVRDYFIPLSKSLASLRSYFVTKNYYPPSALDFTKPSIFNSSCFNSFFYNPRGTNSRYSNDVAGLGKLLFFDPIFSENNKRACASCHKPGNAFTDNVRLGSDFHGAEKLHRNTPTILNAAIQRNYFYDLRAGNLEMQVGHVLTNEKEMKGNFDSLVWKLNSSSEYVNLFRKVFKGTRDTVIQMNSIVNAIAEYERKLVSFNSKFDRNIRAEEKTFTKEEQNGFNIFMNKGRCATCHYLPLFNNLVPPEYTRSEWEIIGTTTNSDTIHPVLDPDPGRGGLFGTKIFMNAFKTPTLRNISLTGPYMHNGAFEKLEDVIEFYNRGGGVGLGLNISNQTLSPEPLHLSEKEKKALLSFMNTLSDTINLTSKPLRLPSFPENSILNNRRIGGEY